MPDAATLRDRWADVLDSIRDVSKVAWTLLNNATVDSVEGSVLTLAFSQVGYAKGFGSSGCDQGLAEVLDRMFGVRPVIKTVVQPASERGDTTDVDHARSDSPRSDNSNPDASRPDSSRTDRASASVGTRDIAAEGGGPDATAATAARSADGVRVARAAGRSAKTRANTGNTRRTDPELTDDPRPHTDQTRPGSGDDLSGTDLIVRELGGHVIEEIGGD